MIDARQRNKEHTRTHTHTHFIARPESINPRRHPAYGTTPHTSGDRQATFVDSARLASEVRGTTVVLVREKSARETKRRSQLFYTRTTLRTFATHTRNTNTSKLRQSKLDAHQHGLTSRDTRASNAPYRYGKKRIRPRPSPPLEHNNTIP